MKVFEIDMKIKIKENRLNFDSSFINKYKNKFRIIYNNKIYPLNNKFDNLDDIKEIKINLISLKQLPLYDIPNIRYIKKEEEIDKYEDEEEDDRIRLFGRYFISNNNDKCLIIYKDEIFPLQEYFLIKDIENKKNLEIKLLILEKITGLTYLFNKCKSLTEIELFGKNEKNLNKYNEDNLKNVSSIVNENDNKYTEFYNTIEEKDFYPSKPNKSLTITDCYSIINQKYSGTISSLYSFNKLFNMKKMCIKSKSIIYLPKIISMEGMFSWCSSLKSLPDISNFDTKNVKIMYKLFSGCSSLISLPDISKWNTRNVSDMGGIFEGCSSLLSLPDISKWNTDNVMYMNNMFNYCSSLTSLPDISRWNINKVTDMNYIFWECSRLSSLPDISKWNTNNLTKMSFMFCGCSSLLSLPDISKWNINNVFEMVDIFGNCSSLLYLPDISKWNTSNVQFIV